MSKRNPATLGIWGTEASGATRVVASESMWKEPVRWNKRQADLERDFRCYPMAAGGKPIEPWNNRPRVFCGSLLDVFEDWQGLMVNHNSNCMAITGSDEWITGTARVRNAQGGRDLTMSDVRRRLFHLIDKTPNLDWLLLTKRPENIRKMTPANDDNKGLSRCQMTFDSYIGIDYSGAGTPRCHVPRENLWLGYSVACQDDLAKVSELLKCRDLCSKLFLSVEPLIGPVDLTNARIGSHVFSLPWNVLAAHDEPVDMGIYIRYSGIDWVIVGGESGHNARPCDIKWIGDIIQQCKSAGVPCFVKQLGAAPMYRAHPPRGDDNRSGMRGLKMDGMQHPKGGDPYEWPEDLRVREFPDAQ